MSEEQYLSTTRGGTGIDSSGLTGIVAVNAGVWGIGGAIVDADISPTAAIQRSKLANGAINQVVINDGSGVLSSEAQLGVSRGGTGQNFSAVAGPVVMTITGGVVSATLPYATTATATTLAERDGTGSLFMVDGSMSGQAKTNTIVPFSGTAITVGTGSGPSYTQTTTFKNDSITQFIETGATITSFARDGQTVGASTATLLTFATTLNSVHDFEATISGVDTANANVATFVWRAKAKNSVGVVTVTLIDQKRSRDAALATATTTIGASGSNVVVQATGIALLTIKWTTSVNVTTRSV
jgi:hypothetical protein